MTIKYVPVIKCDGMDCDYEIQIDEPTRENAQERVLKSNATIELEFLLGTSIEDAVTEAKEKAWIFNLAYVTFKFNGVRMSIGPTADVKQASEEFRNKLSAEHKYVVAK